MKAKDNSYNKTLHGLKQLAMGLKGIAAGAVIEYSREVDEIVVFQSQDSDRIERTLDGMLDFCYDKNMLELYKKLCRYYYGINPSATVSYVRYYRETWDPQDKAPWKTAVKKQKK